MSSAAGDDVLLAVDVGDSSARDGRLNGFNGGGDRFSEPGRLSIELGGLYAVGHPECGVITPSLEQSLLGILGHHIGALDGQSEAELGHDVRPLAGGSWCGQFRTRWRSRLAWLPGLFGGDQTDTRHASGPS